MLFLLGLKTIGIGENGIFIGVVSFIMGMKAKIRLENRKRVFHHGNEGQNPVGK
ncbi:hypothetical protein [Bacillus massilinigeriensis]|uniref:hypothetical protein n=1 Tax=Bacillus massilionigeriensis TaxID=1805475 RepID=UPI0013566E01|nr:hypothetical protein [Bacillus massilionigeriensis]